MKDRTYTSWKSDIGWCSGGELYMWQSWSVFFSKYQSEPQYFIAAHRSIVLWSWLLISMGWMLWNAKSYREGVEDWQGSSLYQTSIAQPSSDIISIEQMEASCQIHLLTSNPVIHLHLAVPNAQPLSGTKYKILLLIDSLWYLIFWRKNLGGTLSEDAKRGNDLYTIQQMWCNM